jgi:hypothetical protein
MPNDTPEHIEAILTTLRTEFDYVILDMGCLWETAPYPLLKRDSIYFVVTRISPRCTRKACIKAGGFEPSEKIKIVVNKDGISKVRNEDT